MLDGLHQVGGGTGREGLDMGYFEAERVSQQALDSLQQVGSGPGERRGGSGVGTAVLASADVLQLPPLLRVLPLLTLLLQESGMMASLRHPNIVSVLGVVTSPPCLVSEYCARG